MVKPFTVEQVQQAVDHALQETRLAREKDELTRNLIAAKTVRQTVVTLSHYINNRLMVLDGGLTLLQENLEQELGANPALARVMRDSNASVGHIAAVLRVLQCVTAVKQTTYHGQVRMIDIEAALREELARGDVKKR